MTTVVACFRAIFLWLCSKDLSKLKFPNPEKGSPEEILMNLQQGYTTYARVYEMLCRCGEKLFYEYVLNVKMIICSYSKMWNFKKFVTIMDKFIVFLPFAVQSQEFVLHFRSCTQR